MTIFENLENQEYFLRRYNKIVLQWSKNIQVRDAQNLLTSVILRFIQACGDEKELISKYFNFLEVAPLNVVNDALSEGQFKSKIWLRDQVKEHLGKRELGQTIVLGGWIGLLGPILLCENLFRIEKLFSIDRDPKCLDLADLLNTLWLTNEWQFKAITGDASQFDFNDFRATTTQLINNTNISIDFTINPVQTIINTSCEHFALESWLPKVPKGTLLILQSNNNESLKEHKFCHSSAVEFLKELDLSEVIYSGTMELDHYQRFLVIGLK